MDVDIVDYLFYVFSVYIYLLNVACKKLKIVGF